MTRVVIVEDHPIVREGIKRLLPAPEFTVVGEASDGEEALNTIRTAPCDLVILDISLPKKDGMDVLKSVRAEMPALPVLVMSVHSEDDYAAYCLRAGAAGYVTKGAGTSDLLLALRKVARGSRYTSPALAEKIALGMLDQRDRPAKEILSRREFQILTMISWGRTVTEIARELNLSVKTVSTYRSRLLEKLSLRNNGELTRYAIRQKVEPPPVSVPAVSVTGATESVAS
jgi:two-component system invasion response regulator UvrY